MPDGMPVFVIKAKDELAVPTILDYLKHCRASGNLEQAREVGKALIEFIEWELANPGQIKRPDHVHVPVARDA
jgi:hypothetical protein